MSVQRKKGGHQYPNTLTISAAHTAKQHDLHCISVVLMVGMSFFSHHYTAVLGRRMGRGSIGWVDMVHRMYRSVLD